MNRLIQALSSLRPQVRYLVGVSGGLDSLALLHALHAGGFSKLTVCHLNHSLRASASSVMAAWRARLAASCASSSCARHGGRGEGIVVPQQLPAHNEGGGLGRCVCVAGCASVCVRSVPWT